MLVPIRSITRKSTGDVFEFGPSATEPGPSCIELSKKLKGIQRGVVEDTFGWLRPVSNPDPVESVANQKAESNGSGPHEAGQTNGHLEKVLDGPTEETLVAAS